MMFKAMGRWLKALMYLMTGQIDSARRTLDKNPHVIRAKFDEIVSDKTTRIQQYKQAVSALIAQQENKMAKVKGLTEDIQKLEALKSGALAKAKQTVNELQAAGKSKEDVQNDENYKKCLAAFNDFSSTLAEKQTHIEELEADIRDYEKRIKDHKIQLQSLVRELEKVKAEAADTVADMITASQEKEISDALSGIAQDGTAEELQRMRQLRQEVKAEARISKELAGTDTKAQEAEFLEYARATASNDEFDQLIGLASAQDKKSQAKADVAADKKDASLPE